MTLMTFKIPDITWDVGYFFKLLMYFVRGIARAWMALRARNPSRANLPLWTLRARSADLGKGPYLRNGSRRARWVPRSWEHEEMPAAGKEKNAEGPTKHIHINVYIYILEIWKRTSIKYTHHLNCWILLHTSESMPERLRINRSAYTTRTTVLESTLFPP